MCPYLKVGHCELAGIEPEAVPCVESRICFGRDWEDCKVHISNYFIVTRAEASLAGSVFTEM